MINLDLLPNRQQIDAFMNQPLTRRQFLMRIGAMAAAVFGVTALLNNLQSLGNTRQATPQNSVSRKNSSYGGKL